MLNFYMNFVNIGALCLFSEIWYELNAVEIDKNKNVELMSLMKVFSSINPNQLKFLEIAGCSPNKIFTAKGENLNTIFDVDGNWEVMVPLSLVLEFAED